MASATVAKKLREEATCPICLELMTEPVSIDCGHSYCRVCIVGLIGNQGSETSSLGTFHCPQCREPFTRDSIRPNKHLANIIETIKETENESVCEKHGEYLHLFCEDDGQLICWCCEHSPQHKGHVTALVEDVCEGYKEEIQKRLTELKATASKYMQLKLETTEKISSWEEKIKHEKERIHLEFMNLHTFLHQEEETYMCRLEKEKEQKLSRLQDNVAYLEDKLQELQSSTLELQKKYKGSAQNLLQDIKDTLNRNSDFNVKPPKDISLKLDTVCNVSELYFDLRKMLKRYQVTVTLDRDTAHPELNLIENQRGVWNAAIFSTKRSMWSETPRGVGLLRCVLGRERFTSGRHYFEVDVRNGNLCSIGVCLENVPRYTLKPGSGLWIIELRKDKMGFAVTSNASSFTLSSQPEVIGIMLDYEAGLVSFYNATTGSHIYTFSKASFSQAVRPYFQVHSYSSLFLIRSK